MFWTELHSTILGNAFERVLGRAEPGAMAFVRCLTSDVVEALASDANFAPSGWHVWRVADANDVTARQITADGAVEIRETKGPATILLVNTARAGAGMDGIYSAAHEVDEADLFREALRLAAHEVTRRLSRRIARMPSARSEKARGFGRRFSVSPWTELDFFVHAAAEQRHPGEYLHLLGLWPVTECGQSAEADLELSRMFVDRLLGTSVSGITPARRIEALKLSNPSEQQIADLERFLRSAATKPLLSALAELADKNHLWVNGLRIEGKPEIILGIELLSWRTNAGRVAKWSGLVEEGDSGEPPVLILKPDADKTGDYSKVEMKWKARPENLEKGAVEYRVVVMTDMQEELASREVTHSGKKEERCRFSNDDFSMLSEDA